MTARLINPDLYDLEADLIRIRNEPWFSAIVAKHDELLTKLGNADGDEAVALVILATEQVKA